MSNRNNDVFQVLVTSDNKGMLAAGNPIENLLPGQLGAFDAKTNLSVGVATSPMPRELFFAVGTDKDNTGVMTDIKTSAGQFIQRPNITAYSFKPHSAGKPMVVTVGGYKSVACDTTYAVRVEFRNSRIARIQGTTQFSKAYVVTTPICEDCGTGCDTDANILTKLLVKEIGLDVSGMLVAKAIARQPIVAGTHGSGTSYNTGQVVAADDLELIIAYNKDAADSDKVYTDIQITSVPLKIGAFAQINLGYHKLLETVLLVSLVEGFSGSGASVVSTYPAFEEGSGANILQKEYHSSGWNGSPYKLSEVLGMAKGDIQYFADKNKKYDQFALEYFQKSESGWLEYENTMSTIFATPATDTTTRASVAAFLDALTASLGFEPLADDAAQANVNPAIVEPAVTDVTKDGLA